MRYAKLLFLWCLMGVTFFACELPQKPDFKASHKLEGPILVNKTYQFLGGGGPGEVLIDTTKSDFDSLFVVDQNSFVSLSKEETFDIGDLDDAIPQISTDPTSFNAQVGELSIGSFSSGSGLGSAGFQEVTGLNPAIVPADTKIPAGSTPAPVNIDISGNTDFFVSATIKSGSVEIAITNNLGFDITSVNLVLRSGATAVSSTALNNVNHGQTTSGVLGFSDGDILQDLNVDVDVAWSAQTTQAQPGDLVVESVQGNNLAASSVEAALDEQSFSTTSSSSFDDSDFRFTSPAHYAELESGVLNIDPIVNELNLSVESLEISFPGIRSFPFNAGDSLVISYDADGGVPAGDGFGSPGVSVSKQIDLAGYRIFAPGNEITYTISAQTENTKNAPSGEQTRVITEDQQISSSVQLTNLSIAEAFGEVVAQRVVLGDDDPANGTDVLDLFNDTEAEVTEFDGLEDISSEIDGIRFTQASLSINYETNIAVPTTIYGAFLSISSDGEQVYMRGLPGQSTAVTATDSITGLNINGVQIPADSLIRFELTPSKSGGTESYSITFDETNSTVVMFFNNLPTEIRFIGKSVVNEGGGEATVAAPLEFDPVISVDIPLSLRTTEETVFTDTTETDVLRNLLPSPEDDARLTEGILNLNYSNGLPLGFRLKLRFLDEQGIEFLSLPADANESFDLESAQVNASTRFAETPTEGNLQIALTEGQLSELYRTASIVIDSNLNTSNNDEVRFRATDAITLNLGAKLTIVNNVEVNF